MYSYSCLCDRTLYLYLFGHLIQSMRWVRLRTGSAVFLSALVDLESSVPSAEKFCAEATGTIKIQLQTCPSILLLAVFSIALVGILNYPRRRNNRMCVFSYF